ncbi:TFIID-18kDa-domain-containing protein [Ganoderma leucocontextum]|nr:TFIID-18kDa-domain-containing protein [Ganoderma leucocontextum]
MATATKKTTYAPEALGHREYKYSQEISQMMFVFGEVQDPNQETVNLVEDIVRSQLIELILQARALASRRGARHLSAEDLIFLIRHDRAKVNRLRTYLSWKDVRKHAKDSDGGGGGGVEVEQLEDDKLTAKAQKITIKLPWEIMNMFSDVLPTDDEEDEDDIEAHEASIQRLKPAGPPPRRLPSDLHYCHAIYLIHLLPQEADDATRQMTREEYQHYSDCRQASFTYRKAKRFKEFLNLPASLDFKTGDDTVDIVGFLAFEMVRALTIAGLEVKKSLEDAYMRDAPHGSGSSPVLGKRKAHLGLGGGADAKRLRREESPEHDADQPLPVCALFAQPPEARTSLRPEHIQDAFARMQGDWAQRRSAGMRNHRGGLIRTTVSLI